MSAPDTTFNSLYCDHHGWLNGWLRRRLDCHEQAADLAQDTFVRALTSDTLSEVREPRAWLTTIARNLLLMHYRRRSLEQAYLETLAAMPEKLWPSPEQQALILEAVNEIDTMLHGLPAPVRDAFLLAQLDGLTYAQIAQQLGVSERSVKRYVTQAMTQCILLTP